MPTTLQPKTTCAKTPAATNALHVTSSFAGTQQAAKVLTLIRSPKRSTKPWRRPDLTGFCIGTRFDTDLPVVGMPSPSFMLIEARGECFVLRFRETWRGWLSTPEGTSTLRDLIDCGQAGCSREPGIFEVVIPPHGTLRLEWGAVDICIRPERKPKPVPREPVQIATHPLLRPIIGSSVFFLGLLLVLSRLPEDEYYLEDGKRAEVERLVQIQADALKAEHHKNEPATDSRPPSHRDIPKPTKARETLSSISQGANEAPLYLPRTREEAVGQAKRAGILALIPGTSGLGSAAFDNYVKSIAFDSSDENIQSYGDLAPHNLDEAAGGWGYGIRKIGPGSGDGKDYGTVKAGDYQLGTGEWLSGLAAYEANALSRPHKVRKPAMAAAAEAIIDSGVKYDVIRGQLGLRKRKLRRCFEEDETRDFGPPSHLHMTFRITAKGTVENAEAADVEEAQIRLCVENTLLSIHFPEPKDGKPVQVDGFLLRI